MTDSLYTSVLALAPIVGGTLTTYLYEDDAALSWRVSAGACTGFVAFGLIGFCLASWLGLTALTLILSTAVAISPVGLLLIRSIREAALADLSTAARTLEQSIRRPTLYSVSLILFSIAIAVLLWTVFDRAVFERVDGAYTGVMNNFGDLPFHIGVISRFVYGDNFPPEDPTYAGASFTYPFLIDFVAAMFMRTANLRTALLMENLILAFSFVVLLHRWALDLTADRRAALLTPFLTLFSGGLGWWLLLGEARQDDRTLADILGHLTHDYTIMRGNEWRWGNIITTLLVPQRSFLLGLPLALVVFTLWWRATLGNPAHADGERTAGERWGRVPVSTWRRMVAAGVIAGFLPLAHAHTFLVVMGAAAWFTLLEGPWRVWAAFYAAAVAIALPQILWSAHTSAVNVGSAVGWQVGWDSGTQNLLWFWFKNTGLLIPLTVVALLWTGAGAPVSERLRRFYLPFTLCFVIANVVRLAPWVWDNIKVLIYWYLASVPLAALVLARLSRGNGWRRLASGLMVASLVLAGGLDVWRVVSRASEAQIFSRSGIDFATMVRATTPPRALILHAPVANHPVFLTGRRSLMGYPGHVWSHGLDVPGPPGRY